MDWGSGVSGGATGWGVGSKIGTMIGGPLGTMIGGAAGALGGGLLGLLGGGEEEAGPDPQDPMRDYMNSQFAKLQNDDSAEEFAAHQSGLIRANANRAYETIANNENFSGNASVLSSANNQIQRTAQDGMIGANLQGKAMQDKKDEAMMSLAANQQQFNYKANQDAQARADRPTALETIASSGLTKLAGSALGALGGGGGGGEGGGGGGLGNVISSVFGGGDDTGGATGPATPGADLYQNGGGFDWSQWMGQSNAGNYQIPQFTGW